MVGDEFSLPRPWPRFELVRIRVSPDVPASLAARLEGVGVPRGLLGWEYRAMDIASPLSGVRSDLVAFGFSGLDGHLCVDGGSGSVVHVASPDVAVANSVNAELELFSASVEAIIKRFPFYSNESDLEQPDLVAAEVRQTLSGIDEISLAHNGFWETFVDDVAAGDYATEELVLPDSPRFG